MNIKKIFLLLLLASATGCVISHHTDPLREPKPLNVCIAENKLVIRPEFLPALIEAFQTRGINARSIPASYSKSGKNLSAKWDPTDVAGCEVIATYNAQWTWDLSLYLVYANVRLYRDDKIIGNAEYNAAMGGFRPDKYASAKSKLSDLMDRLLPQEGATVKNPMKDSANPVIEKTPEPQVIKKNSEPQIIKKNQASQSDTTIKLKKLQELRDAGLITQIEYDSKRAKIIESL